MGVLPLASPASVLLSVLFTAKEFLSMDVQIRLSSIPHAWTDFSCHCLKLPQQAASSQRDFAFCLFFCRVIWNGQKIHGDGSVLTEEGMVPIIIQLQRSLNISQKYIDFDRIWTLKSRFDCDQQAIESRDTKTLWDFLKKIQMNFENAWKILGLFYCETKTTPETQN